MEHRCGYRIPVDQTVRVTIAEHPSVIARLRDVSASGAFLITPVRAPYLGLVCLHLRVRRNHRDHESLLEGLAVRNAPDGIGIEWLDFSPAFVRHFAQGSLLRPADAGPIPVWRQQRQQ